jgi:hypothetical protein
LLTSRHDRERVEPFSAPDDAETKQQSDKSGGDNRRHEQLRISACGSGDSRLERGRVVDERPHSLE